MGEIAAAPKPGKPQVVYPIGLPGQGYFDWVDSFLEQNPDFIELSDRKVIDWAVQSGLWRPKGPGTNDSPDMKFGLPLMDDYSVRRLIAHIAPMSRRNFIIPQMLSNLRAGDRQDSLQAFMAHGYTKVATMVVGEPDAQYKEYIQVKMVADKKARAETARKKQKFEEERKRLL